MYVRYCSVLYLLLIGLITLPVSAETSPDTSSPTYHALLIGIQDYPSGSYPRGGEVYSLSAPENDLDLVRDVLESRFDVPPDNIVTLVNEQATHTEIKQAFVNLANRVNSGDFVYIHYSGHGSQADDENNDEERSGKDQTWVSYGARSGRFTGDDDLDVLDDEINEWLLPLYAKTDHVVFVSDSCHSATVGRGERLTTVRAVPQDPRPHPLAAKQFQSRADAPGVRIGGARDREVAIEFQNDQGRNYGLFTWYWIQAINRARPGETWNDVFKRAYTLVSTHQGANQRPQLEGHGEQTVFGGQFVEPKPTVQVTRWDGDTRSLTIQAGAASGVTEESIYHLYDEEETDQEDLPRLKITRVGTFSSEGKALQSTFQKGDLVVEAVHAYPFKPLKLYPYGDFAQGKDKPLLQGLRESLQGLRGFQLVSQQSKADYLLHILRPKQKEGRYIYASESHTLPKSFPDQPPEVWVLSSQKELLHEHMRIPLQNPEKSIEVLKENLNKFARVRQLKQLGLQEEAPPLNFEVFLLRLDPDCTQNCVDLPDPEGGENTYRKSGPHDIERIESLSPQSGDILTFAVENQSRHDDYYVYLLNITPKGGIKAIFPRPEDRPECNRLAPSPLLSCQARGRGLNGYEQIVGPRKVTESEIRERTDWTDDYSFEQPSGSDAIGKAVTGAAILGIGAILFDMFDDDEDEGEAEEDVIRQETLDRGSGE